MKLFFEEGGEGGGVGVGVNYSIRSRYNSTIVILTYLTMKTLFFLSKIVQVHTRIKHKK